MKLRDRLQELLHNGFHRIGQIEILHGTALPANLGSSVAYVLHHQDDADLDSLEAFQDPNAARQISTFADDGEYRFTKGQTNLRSGWVMHLSNLDDLLLALEGFYPAGFSLWAAQQNGTLQVQNLRDKLNRQTGMYRFARGISDAGAQTLIQRVCGPANQCAKKILWQLDATTPLDDNEATRFNGIASGLSEPHAIPLYCREACNHFVAECRKASKKEFDDKAAASGNA
jgi:4Fe-4S iron-sulfur cluster binding domain/DR2241 stabilising domain